MAKKIVSWLDYIDTLQKRSFSPEDLQIEELDQISNIKEITSSVFNHSIPWIYLLDYTTGNYMVISNSLSTMLGYEPAEFLKEGIGFTFERYNPKHLKIFNEEIFPDRLMILKKIPYQEHRDYIFSYNFQFKNSRGEFVDLLQRSSFIKSDENNNPLMSFGVITNVTHFKTEIPIIQTVEKINPRDGLNNVETYFKKSYFLNNENSFFTRREKELLPYLADGLSSKEIAHKLHISEFTVTNHRRNMMEKTGSNNITQLVSFALRNCIF